MNKEMPTMPSLPTTAISAEALLELEGYAVHVAHDGMQAFRIATDVKPLACFLDIGMPGMDGYEVARRLKATIHGAGMFLMATTRWGKPEVTDFVLKRRGSTCT